MRIMRKRKQQQGFTLAELLIAIGIFGVLVWIGLPVLVQFLPSMQLRAGGQEVFRAIQAAKAEANKRNRKVILDFPMENCSVNSIKYTVYTYKACEFVKDASIDDTDPCDKVDPSKKYYTASNMPPHAAVCSDSRVPRQSMARLVFLPTGLLDVKNKERGPFYLHLRHINKDRDMYVQVERSGAVRVLAGDKKPTY